MRRKAREQLGWAPRVNFKALVRRMVDHDLDQARQERTLSDAGHKTVVEGKGSVDSHSRVFVALVAGDWRWLRDPFGRHACRWL